MASPKALINLQYGSPAPSLLPAALLKSAADAALSDPKTYIPGLVYDDEPGFHPARESIAQWLTSFYRPPQATTASRICVTGGASQNLGCILNTYTDPLYTRNIWLLTPAYFLAFRVFEDAGFGVDEKMRAVPEDEQGLDVEFLRRAMEESEARAKRDGLDAPIFKPARSYAKVYKHVVYCVPTFANPSSRTMSLDRRKALVRLAREFDALVVCDDVYDFLRWDADPVGSSLQNGQVPPAGTAHLPRVVDLDREIDGGAERHDADGFGNVCSNGSFSKITGPGIRVGWLEGTEKFAYGVSQTGTTCSGGPPGQLSSTYIDHLLRTGKLQAHIKDTLLPAYSARYSTVMRAVQAHLLPLGFALPQPNRDVIGGYFAWLRLPSSLACSAEALAKRCKRDENVVIAPGDIFEVPGDESIRLDRNIRLCWSWEDEEKLDEGVRRIGDVVRRMLEEDGTNGGEYVVVER